MLSKSDMDKRKSLSYISSLPVRIQSSIQNPSLKIIISKSIIHNTKLNYYFPSAIHFISYFIEILHISSLTVVANSTFFQTTNQKSCRLTRIGCEVHVLLHPASHLSPVHFLSIKGLFCQKLKINQ